MSLEPCGGCQCEIPSKAKVCPYCGFDKNAVNHTKTKSLAFKHTIESLAQERVEKGWRIVQRRETDIVIERGEKIRHGAHIFLTLITFGLWGAVYGISLMTGGLKRRRIEMHRGQVREKRLF